MSVSSIRHRLALIGGFLGLCCLVGSASAQEDFLPDGTPPPQPAEGLRYTLLKPSDKGVEMVKEGERNPFNNGDAGLKSPEAKGSSEENEIRDRLSRLRVVGVSPGSKGLRVMLGDMVLIPGELVPQVLTEQTLSLRVGNISPTTIELIWIEKKPTGLPARVLIIPVDLRPYVRYVLQGQPNDKNQWEKTAAGGAKVPVATEFPEVAQSVAGDVSHLAQNDKTKAAGPVKPDGTPAPAPPDAPGAAAPAPAPTAIKPIPEFEEAMNLLNKLLPLNKGGDKE
ncbi:MAG: hypothetical protein ACAI34_00630 [Verrucomicrobium sp.]|nr:hypothetical protein [Verrucomicrobium sp.]